MPWLSSIIPGSPAVWLGVAIWTAVVAWGASRVTQWVTPEPEVPPPDTVTVERQITKRDTVTETVPKIVRRYDTLRQVDTAFVPIPQQWQPQGLVGTAPLDISGGEATLTYWDHNTRRWTQNVYELPTDTWGIGLDGSVTAAQQWLQATTTLGVSRMTQWGPIDVTSRLGGGYGALVTEEYRAGPVIRAGISIEYRW